MAGQVTVTINGSTWAVSVASSSSELLSGLSGVPGIPAGTGVLFDMGSDQNYVAINMADMLFSLDIAFMNSSGGVVGILRGVEPGESAAFDAGNGLGARYFMEVNAGEMSGISVGDNVDISGEVQPAFWAGLVVAVQAMVAMAVVSATGYRMVKEELKKAKGEQGEHHSIHGAERVRLVEQYGSWAVGRAESVCPEDDVACVEREALNLLAAYKKKAAGKYFYWAMWDHETQEIFEQGYPYSTQGRAVWGARSFASKNIPKEHPVTIKVYDEAPAMGIEERKERTSVYESVWRRI